VPFEEDRAILEAVDKGMSSKTTPNLDLALDAGRPSLPARLAET